MINAPLPDLCGEYWPKPVPPQTHRLVADVDATFEQNVFNLAQRKRIADVQHHREANDLGRTVEISAGISHRLRLRNSPSPLKPIYSDNAIPFIRLPLPLASSAVPTLRMAATLGLLLTCAQLRWFNRLALPGWVSPRRPPCVPQSPNRERVAGSPRIRPRCRTACRTVPPSRP